MSSVSIQIVKIGKNHIGHSVNNSIAGMFALEDFWCLFAEHYDIAIFANVVIVTEGAIRAADLILADYVVVVVGVGAASRLGIESVQHSMFLVALQIIKGNDLIVSNNVIEKDVLQEPHLFASQVVVEIKLKG